MSGAGVWGAVVVLRVASRRPTGLRGLERLVVPVHGRLLDLDLGTMSRVPVRGWNYRW